MSILLIPNLALHITARYGTPRKYKYRGRVQFRTRLVKARHADAGTERGTIAAKVLGVASNAE